MTMKQFLAALFAVMMVFTLACGGGGETASTDEDMGEDDGDVTETQTAETSTAPAAATPASADGAMVSGMIKLAAAAPAMGNIPMSSDAFCSGKHPTPVKSEEVVAGAAGELANVFVWVKDFKGSVPPPSTPALLDQSGCQYIPHVSGVQVGQTLNIKNSDSTMHNVHSLAKINSGFNLSQPVPKTDSKKFTKPEVMIKIKCDVHGWMNSYIGVVPHPYFGVSDASGAFTINGLPAGTYTVEAWHEKFGAKTQQITVAAKEQKQLSFSF